jgi:hypothetical protein
MIYRHHAAYAGVRVFCYKQMKSAFPPSEPRIKKLGNGKQIVRVGGNDLALLDDSKLGIRMDCPLKKALSQASLVKARMRSIGRRGV